MTLCDASIDFETADFRICEDLSDVREAVEQRLEMLVGTLPGVPLNLQQAVRHALLGKSKRVRPVLLYLIAEPSPRQRLCALDLGCAVEMVHTASLILDDLPCMDDAQIRRQRPTTHIAFGQSTAILAAIGLLTRAFGIVAELDEVPEPTRVRLAALLSDAVGWDGLVAGQEIDVNGRQQLKNADQIEELNWLKTGVLFVAAAEMGAVLGGLEDKRLDAVRRFARHLGVAFQTADDLLDQDASTSEAGKDVHKDGDKATLVSLFGASQARMSCQEHLSNAESALAESGVTPAPILELMQRLFATRKAAAQ
ncbi:geranylgeranyl diphosphate synthase, type II [Devosia crocina]|uniref:Probable farnesyl diphosphate synthase n=1 Tax=Devosia crocina TaxID=429728 RepID=A0A1I7NUT9_9HYPH|nr:polyprenyl synthetase family protein [Devosia crocina]SFV38421.1 geranylgeranyl diphosphate synthase, type II [Devosia crocina]